MSGNKKRILYGGGIVAALIVVCVVVFCFLLVDTTKADWTMYGYEISPNGEISRTVEFTLNARLREYAVGGNDLTFSIHSFPQSQVYSLFDESSYYQPGESENPTAYYPFSFNYYDVNIGGTFSDTGALSLDEKMMILQIGSTSKYIVAAADPNVQAADVIAHFEAYFDVWDLNEKTNHTEWEQLDWQLYGAWVSESGVESEKIAISFSGKMPTEISEDHCLHEIEIQIGFPENFPYQQDTKEMTAICMRSDENTRSYFHCDGFSSNKSTLKADKISFYVFPDTEQIVFQWSDSEGRYFVAATDPDADPAEILNLYLECFNANYGSPKQ